MLDFKLKNVKRGREDVKRGVEGVHRRIDRRT